MVNALHLAAKIIDTLPHVTLTPETTEGRQGFIHLYQMSGTAAAAELNFILRDFEPDLLQAQGDLIQKVCATIQATEPRAQISCTISSQYQNMRYWLENDMRPVELAREACRQLGIEHFSCRFVAAPMAHGSPKKVYQRPISLPACKTFTAHWNGSVSRIWRLPPKCVSGWRSCGSHEA